MAKNRRLESYSQEERAEITQLLETMSMSEISRARGIPYDMIRRIRDYDPAKEAERHEKQRLASIERNTVPGTYVECAMCGYRSPDIKRHINTVHSMSTRQFKEQTSQTIFTSETRKRSDSERMKGDKNPAAAHGGRLSPWSKNFKNGYDSERHDKFKQSVSDRLKTSPGVFQREFYDSDEAYTKAQIRDLKWFQDKYGKEEGKIRHRAKTEKWMKSYKKSNFSKVSQELFWALEPYFSVDVRFATREKDGVNREMVLPLFDSYIKPDFIDVVNRKIIEFDGDYWHTESTAASDLRRDEALNAAGYSVLRVKEHRFNKDREGTIQECINFLTR